VICVRDSAHALSRVLRLNYIYVIKAKLHLISHSPNTGNSIVHLNLHKSNVMDERHKPATLQRRKFLLKRTAATASADWNGAWRDTSIDDAIEQVGNENSIQLYQLTLRKLAGVISFVVWFLVVLCYFLARDVLHFTVSCMIIIIIIIIIIIRELYSAIIPLGGYRGMLSMLCIFLFLCVCVFLCWMY